MRGGAHLLCRAMIAAPRLACRRRAAVRAIATFRDSYGLWIDGCEVQAEGGRQLPVENPANREIITHVQAAQPSDVGLAVDAGRRAFDDGVWSRADVRDRANVLNEAARLLRQRVPEFAAKEVVQTGRAVREMNAQVRFPRLGPVIQRAAPGHAPATRRAVGPPS